MEPPLVVPNNMVEHLWVYWLEKVGPFGVFISFYIIMAGLYALGGYLFYLIDKHQLLPQYKIQAKSYATNADYVRCIKNLVLNYVVIIFPLGCISFPFTSNLHLSYSLPLPGMVEWCVGITICFVGEDICHYWMHRFFHTPWFYKNIHKEHHFYATPFGLAATYSHWVEVICLGMCTFAPALVIRPHFFTFYCWFVLRQLDAVLTHSGYEFPWLPFHLIPFYGGTTFHDYHHKSFNCNYASRFTWLDKLFNTYRDPPEEQSNKKTK